MKSTLASVTDLAARPGWRIFDCRHDLTNPRKGAELYALGHIHGALYAHLDKDLSGVKTGKNGRHPLPDARDFMRWLGQCGVGKQDQIVAYDASGGIFAARLWWLCRWVGHEAVAVLDGGLDAWLRQGMPLSTEVPALSPVEHDGAADDGLVVDASFVEANLHKREARLLDARAANRYAGRDETLDPVGGHIPGALNRPYADNLSAGGYFKSVDALRAEFRSILGSTRPQDVVSQCGSGVTACHNLLAMEIAGLGGARLYPGSWSEWCSSPERPVATGLEP